MNKYILNLISFLSNSKTPTIINKEDLKNVNHMTSKKFYMVLVSVFILLLFYILSIGVLFLLPTSSEVINGFITIFAKTIEVLSIIIASYIGAQAVVDLKYGNSSNMSLSSSSVTETKNKKITYVESNQKEDDYEIK